MKRLLLILLLGIIALSACADNNQATSEASETIPAEYAGRTNPLGSGSDAASQGAIVFQNYCQSCHGPQGHGDGPAGGSLDPEPKNLAELQATVKDDYLFWRISDGREGTAMVPWKGILTEEQIWQVIAFIRTLR